MRSPIGLAAALVALAVPLSLSASAPAAASSHGTIAQCAPGILVAHKSYRTSHGRFLVEETRNAQRTEYAICVITPLEKIKRQNGVFVARFADGSTFKTDSLGHVFYQLYPGQVTGVGVLVFTGRRVKQLGIYADAKVIRHRGKPFAIRKFHNNCTPSCADGHITKKTLTWQPKTKTYR